MKWTAMRKVVLVVALVGLTGAGYAWYRSAPEGTPRRGVRRVGRLAALRAPEVRGEPPAWAGRP